jgi:hypothetical protein
MDCRTLPRLVVFVQVDVRAAKVSGELVFMTARVRGHECGPRATDRVSAVMPFTHKNRGKAMRQGLAFIQRPRSPMPTALLTCTDKQASSGRFLKRQEGDS